MKMKKGGKGKCSSPKKNARGSYGGMPKGRKRK